MCKDLRHCQSQVFEVGKKCFQWLYCVAYIGGMGNILLIVFISFAFPFVASKSVRKDFSVITEKLESSRRSVRVNGFIMDVYKKAQENQGGTIKVKVGKRNLIVDEVCGYEPVKRVQPYLGLVHSFYFNTSGLGKNDTVIAAQLVFSVNQDRASPFINISLDAGVDLENQTRLEPLTWKMMKRRKRMALNVKMAVKNWIARQETLGILEMRARLQRGKRREQSISPRHVYRESTMPCIIVYVSNSRAKKASSVLLELLNKQTVLLPRTLPVVSNTKFDPQKLPLVQAKGGIRSGIRYPSCHKSSLSVVLTKLFDWVLNPLGPVSIGLCSGLCYAPISSSLQPTNHATIMSLLLKKRGVREPMRPHCVPLELTGLKVIYLDQFTHTIKVRVWDKTIVKKCGCR